MSIIRIEITEENFLDKYNIWEVSLSSTSLFSFIFPVGKEPLAEEVEDIIKDGLTCDGFFPIPFNFSIANILIPDDGNDKSILKINADGDVSVETGSKSTPLDPQRLLKDIPEELSEKAMELLSQVTDLNGEEATSLISSIRENASSIKRITEIFIECESRFSTKCNSEKCFKAIVEVFGNHPVSVLEEKLIARASGVEKLEVLGL